jgi:hypothetical protein
VRSIVLAAVESVDGVTVVVSLWQARHSRGIEVTSSIDEKEVRDLLSESIFQLTRFLSPEK